MTTSSAAPRILSQLLPEKVENSPRSSNRGLEHMPEEMTLAGEKIDKKDFQAADMSAGVKPRSKFLPQPVEESTRSSRKHKISQVEEVVQEQAETEKDTQTSRSHEPIRSDSPSNKSSTANTSRRFAPDPVETTSRTSRRKFAPEPVETSARSSKEKKEDTRQSSPSSKPVRRKFASEPVESTARSSKDKNKGRDEQDTSVSSRPRRKFAPEPVETTTTTRRRRKPEPEEKEEEDNEEEEQEENNLKPASTTPSRTSSGGRRFSPDLIETAKGSYRRGYISPASQSRNNSHPSSTAEEADKVPELPESRFSAAALAKKHHEEHRQKSFIIPDLPMIESDSGDDGSDAPSLTSSSSSSIDTGHTSSSKQPAEAISYTDYVLRLAAQTATEKELQDQAMAAYINERPHEPVDHFAIDHGEDDDGRIHVGRFSGDKGVDPRTFRRSSASDLDWEMENMRKHHEQLENAKRELKADTAGHSRFSAAALVTRHHLEASKAKQAPAKRKSKAKKTKVADSELAKMRAAASPPMLGDDLVFPYTISPKMTRCDTDQVPRPRTADSDDEDETMQGNPQLWAANINITNQGGVGLWMGMCQRTHQEPSRPPTPIRSGIQTPAVEVANPIESSTPGRGGNHTPGRRMGRPFSANLIISPLTPPQSSDGNDIFTSTIDRKLQVEAQIEEEFPNAVITQIYNYLSLGYPNLAHGFDEELSKISRISIDELRRDDSIVDVKGHVGVPEGEGCDESEILGGRCKRWEALRVYVHEWARQSPNFVEPKARGGKAGANEAWGAAVRKGSWAH